MRSVKQWPILLSAILLSGCVSAERIAQRDAEACSNLGFTRGTDAFASCRLQLHSHRAASRASLRASAN